MNLVVRGEVIFRFRDFLVGFFYVVFRFFVFFDFLLKLSVLFIWSLRKGF